MRTGRGLVSVVLFVLVPQVRLSKRLDVGGAAERWIARLEDRVVGRGPYDFEYQGQRFKSLTAIARHITGTPWSGPAFFGLKTKGGQKEPA